jgi:DNA-directed RNA polymerase subunit RPC12/RpoP
LGVRCTVSNSCPDCGADVEFVSRPSRVMNGQCSDCGHAFTIFEGAEPPATGSSAETPGSPAAAGPPCSDCGAALSLAPGPSGSIAAECGGCGSKFQFVLEGSPPPRGPPPRFSRGPPMRDDRRGPPVPGSRPCRECGGPLRFVTSPEGGVTGECESCGNRFTLPPRRDSGFERRGPPRRFNPRYSSRGPPTYRRPERRGRDSENDGPPRRRRRDRE